MDDKWVDTIYEASGLLVGPEQGKAIGAMIEARVKAEVEEALLHTLHPEFGSIYALGGEVTKAVEPLQAEIERLRKDNADILAAVTEGWDQARKRQDQVRNLEAERDRLRAGLLRVMQYENKCDQTGQPCRSPDRCACSLEAAAWCEGDGT